ncbi:MAG: hypothetical protein DMD87_06605 [Candidatus Rokuibacteriota bacterium]|nr:MAG: hypothetical protein DMD87_06605 [Candidatus Rokubacteria bacterium]
MLGDVMRESAQAARSVRILGRARARDSAECGTGSDRPQYVLIDI